MRLLRRLQAAVSGAYDRADGVVTRIARRPLISLALLLDLILTDGALAMMLDALPNDLANPPDTPTDGAGD